MVLPFLSAKAVAPEHPGLALADTEQPAISSYEAGEITVFTGASSVGKSVAQWELRLPENLSYDGIAMFAPGFGGIYESSEAPAEAMANEGLATIRYAPARRGDCLWTDLTKPQKLHRDGLGAILKDVSERLDTRIALQQRKVDTDKQLLVAHSMGLLAALMRAKQVPHATQMVQSKAGCGYGHPTLGELAVHVPKGAIPGLRHEVLPSVLSGDIELGWGAVSGLFRYLKAARLLPEGLSCLLNNMGETAGQLRQEGVTLTHEAYQHDILVVPDPAIAQYVDDYSLMLSAGHLAPIRKAATVAQHTREQLALIH